MCERIGGGGGGLGEMMACGGMNGVIAMLGTAGSAVHMELWGGRCGKCGL